MTFLSTLLGANIVYLWLNVPRAGLCRDATIHVTRDALCPCTAGEPTAPSLPPG